GAPGPGTAPGGVRRSVPRSAVVTSSSQGPPSPSPAPSSESGAPCADPVGASPGPAPAAPGTVAVPTAAERERPSGARNRAAAPPGGAAASGPAGSAAAEILLMSFPSVGCPGAVEDSRAPGVP